MPHLKTCTTCGRAFTPERQRQAKCPAHEVRGRAGRSPTTRAQDAEYRAERARVLAPDPLTGQPPACALRIKCDGAPATTADHIVPISRGGTHHRNLQPACLPCNSSRAGRLCSGEFAAGTTHADAATAMRVRDRLDPILPA